MIRIQQDNAPVHSAAADQAIIAKAKEMGLTIRPYYQPANSPDTNIQDLAFFASLQADIRKVQKKTMGDLIKAVEECYEEYPATKLNRAFLSLQACLNEIMLCGGGNGYKIPHLGKDRLEQMDQLPVSLQVDPAAQYWVAQLSDSSSDAENNENLI